MTKTKISATVVADSKNQFGNRITTMLVTFPRIILAEFNTHRMFSRNTASSRAIPFEKMLKSIEEDPFIPIAWQKDHKGMQGTEYWGKEDWVIDQPNVSQINVYNCATGNWLQAKDNAVSLAKQLNSKNITKQLCNRLLEPFMWTTVIVTATEWENFFALRCPQYELGSGIFRSKKDAIKVTTIEHGELVPPSIWGDITWLQRNKGQAEIHMMALAEAMWDAYNESTPKELQAGEWHIPFGDQIDEPGLVRELELDYEPNEKGSFVTIVEQAKIEIATVRCARTSYTIVGEDQRPLTFQKMIEIHNNLINANPKHMSPFEHCARAMNKEEALEGKIYQSSWAGWSGNFRGFIQYRKMIPNENIK